MTVEEFLESAKLSITAGVAIAEEHPERRAAEVMELFGEMEKLGIECQLDLYVDSEVCCGKIHQNDASLEEVAYALSELNNEKWRKP